MANSLSLKLYLATRARSRRAARKPAATRDGADAARVMAGERNGEASAPRPDGPLLWIHTGQDSHALAARELAHRLRTERAELNILFTTTAEKRRDSTPDALSQLAPTDALSPVRRFLDHWQPSLTLWSEPDVRPALVTQTAKRDIPMFFVDAHTAPSEPHGWRFWPSLSGSLLADFRNVITGDRVKAGSLRRLGADPAKTEVIGYLEEGTAALPCNQAERDALAEELQGRPVWLAVRAADDELEPVLDAHRQALRRTHRLLLILVPEENGHHDGPDAGAELQAALQDQGFVTALRSAGDEPEAETQIYIADSIEELGLWYRLAAVSFLGQSLEASGGVNPFEPAALGSAIIHGPNVRSFRRAYGRLASAGATRMVRNPAQLYESLEELLQPDVAAMMAHEAWKVCTSGAEVTDRAMDLVLAELDAIEDR